jgi:hypothetical protein
MVQAQQRFGEHLEQQLQQAGLADQRPFHGSPKRSQIMKGERLSNCSSRPASSIPDCRRPPFHDPADHPWIR